MYTFYVGSDDSFHGKVEGVGMGMCERLSELRSEGAFYLLAVSDSKHPNQKSHYNLLTNPSS